MSQQQIPFPEISPIVGRYADDFAEAREAWCMRPQHDALQAWLERMDDAARLKPQALLISGGAGAGKAHAAAMLAHCAIENGHEVVVIKQIETLKQEELFSLLQQMEQPPLKLMTMREDWPVAQLPADISSRLKLVPMLMLPSPDEVVMRFILRRECARMQLRVPGNVLEFLSKRVKRSGHEAVVVCVRMAALAASQQRNITLKLAGEMLSANEFIETS